jgi:hypothetical protein
MATKKRGVLVRILADRRVLLDGADGPRWYEPSATVVCVPRVANQLVEDGDAERIRVVFK